MINMGEKILAKSNGLTLEEHTKKVLDCINALQKVSDLGTSQEWDALKYAGLLHDIGKIDPAFQGKIGNPSAKNFQEVKKHHVPHSLFGLFFISLQSLPLSDDLKCILLSAVAFHHWRDNFPDYILGSLTTNINERAANVMEHSGYYESIIEQLKEKLIPLAKENNLTLDALNINKMLLEDLSINELGSLGFVIPPYGMVFLPYRQGMNSMFENEKKRIFITGNLLRSDHFASYMDQNSTVKATDIEIVEKATFEELKNLLLSRFKDGAWQVLYFNKNIDEKDHNMALVAPTGVGKTEFALSWGAGRKLFFILPMRVAANSMYLRIRNLLNDIDSGLGYNVALLHGEAAQTLTHILGNNTEEIEEETRQVLELARHLSYPYIVCTADQIVPSALRFPGFERIYASMMEANVVIDEVQAYDPRAAAIITHFIQQISSLGGKVLLVTATMPGFVEKALRDRTDMTFRRFLDTEYGKQMKTVCRHRVVIEKYSQENPVHAEKIISEAKKGKKVLVVMNTVGSSKKIYDLVRKILDEKKSNIRCILLHSHFTMEDRRKKEKEIFSLMPNDDKEEKGIGCIVISTQIVEASLDIDADIMFTEITPVDSLVQRMGRVNRNRKNWKQIKDSNSLGESPNVIIWVHENNKKSTEKNIKIGAGIGPIRSVDSKNVYDFEFTVLTLVVLKAIYEAQKDLKGIDSYIENTLANLNNKKDKDIINYLMTEIERLEDVKIVLDEKDKQLWVTKVYEYLEKGALNNAPSSYLDIYHETLEILDYGYCSSKKSEAQKLFRCFNNVEIIPLNLYEKTFDNLIKELSSNKPERFSYAHFSDKVLNRLVINVPTYMFRKWQEDRNVWDAFSKIAETKPSFIETIGKTTLKRWLSGIYIVDIRYDEETGLEKGSG